MSAVDEYKIEQQWRRSGGVLHPMRDLLFVFGDCDGAVACHEGMPSREHRVDITLRRKYIRILPQIKTHDFGFGRRDSKEKQGGMPRVEPDFHDGLGCALKDEFAKACDLCVDLVGPPSTI